MGKPPTLTVKRINGGNDEHLAQYPFTNLGNCLGSSKSKLACGDGFSSTQPRYSFFTAAKTGGYFNTRTVVMAGHNETRQPLETDDSLIVQIDEPLPLCTIHNQALLFNPTVKGQRD